MNEKQTIFHTIHGSHLYGLAHAKSDTDYYEIYIGGNKKNARQTINASNDDVLKMNLWRFLFNVHEGSPQALEALFSPYAEIASEYRAYFEGLNTSPDLARARYRRTIRNFAFNHGGRSASRTQRDSSNDRYKLARHSLRLTLNLNELMRYGRFNPNLSAQHANMITELAYDHTKDSFENTLETMLSDAQWGGLKL